MFAAYLQWAGARSADDNPLLIKDHIHPIGLVMRAFAFRGKSQIIAPGIEDAILAKVAQATLIIPLIDKVTNILFRKNRYIAHTKQPLPIIFSHDTAPILAYPARLVAHTLTFRQLFTTTKKDTTYNRLRPGNPSEIDPISIY